MNDIIVYHLLTVFEMIFGIIINFDSKYSLFILGKSDKQIEDITLMELNNQIEIEVMIVEYLSY